MTPPLRIGLVGNPRYADLATAVGRVRGLAARRGWTLSADAGLDGLPPLDAAHLDLLVTLGGDGTLLRGTRLLDAHPVPVLGVNFGRVGFLTSVDGDDIETALENFADANFRLSHRTSLAATIGNGVEPETVHFALNDVVVHKGGVARVVRFQVFIDDEPMGPVSGDGVVVASPTGSTAYSLSAGGPMVVPDLDAMLVTPICAHALGVRPLVVRADAVIRIEPLEPRTEELLISFDGQETAVFAPDARLDVRMHSTRVALVRFGDSAFFRTLREKLQWGDLNDRAE